MKYVYFSVTGQTRRFINKLNLPASQILELTPFNADDSIHEPFVLIVPTYDKAMVAPVFEFLDNPANQPFFKGVAGSGNRNFAELFIFTAKDIAKAYHVPLLYGFEFSGTSSDVENFQKVVKKLESS